MNEKGSKTVELVTAASLIASSLSGCASPQKAPERDIPNTSESPIVESTEIAYDTVAHREGYLDRVEATPTVLPKETTIYPSTREETPVVTPEIFEFNYEILNITDWSDFELDEVEDKEAGYGINVTKEAPLLMTPLKKDTFLNEKEEVKVILIPTGSTFEIAQTRILVGPNGEKIKVGHIANTYGANIVSTIILEAEDSNGVKNIFTEEKERDTKIVSYVATEDLIYPNKVENILTSLKKISSFQEENDGFKKGEEYSYINIIELKSRSYDYKSGFTTTGGIVRGGGVCAMSTGMSSLIHVQDSDDYKVLERWAEAERYIQGPFSPSKYIVDSSVDYNDSNTYDLRWIQGEDKYLNVNILISPSDIPFEETAQDGVGGTSDVMMIISLSFEDQPRENQTEYITEKLRQYKEYRDSNHATKLSPSQMDINVLNYPITPEIHNSVSLLYDIENLYEFKSVVEEKEEFQDILKLQEAVNTYPDDSEIPLDIYLKGTDWYKQFKDEESQKNANRILQLATTSRVPGQPLQCVGFVMIASWIYPELSIPYVGSGTASTARELIPPHLREPQYGKINSYPTGLGDSFALSGPLTIDMYEPGDLFVRTDGGKAASTNKPTGHIGLIMDKIVKENGDVVLLVADSNRHNDGRIKIFTVNDSNIEEIFGVGQRYIIKFANN